MSRAGPSFRFVKMEGCGNDYVIVDGGLTGDGIDAGALGPLDELARRVSDRHYGVGSDGLILVLPGGNAPVRMRMWNADGSEAELCVNGLRCAAAYAAQSVAGLGEEFPVETGAGPRPVRVRPRTTRISEVEVRVGPPGFLDTASVGAGAPAIQEERFSPEPVTGYRVNVGNPHLVLWRDSVSDVNAADLAALGPRLETDARFPQRINVHWVAVTETGDLHMRSWERGSGITLACGSGAVAAFVVARRQGRVNRTAAVAMPGGTVRLREEADGSVVLTGPAREVFHGEYPLGSRGA